MPDVQNLQAIVARSSAKPYFAVLLFSVVDAGATRGFLRSWMADVPRGFAVEEPGRPALQFLFSWSALEKLVDGTPGLDAAEGRRRFDPFFVGADQAPDKIADQLGLVGNSAPQHWWKGFKTADIELAVVGAFDDEAQRGEVTQRIRQSAQAQGLVQLKSAAFTDGLLQGYRPPGGRLHFGYRDGITNPVVDWNDTGAAGSINFREVIAGYPSEDYPTLPHPAGPWRDFSREGAFACLSWISQDVPRFERFLDENEPTIAEQAGACDAREWLAARLLGRWRNGTPLMLSPNKETDPATFSNAFGYAGDPSGSRCPLTAHIRIVNSRDQPLSFPNHIRFPAGPPQLIRRGFSYGKPWAGDADDRTERGIVGLFFCARVNEQFYTVLRWMARTDFSEVFEDARGGRDALVADRSGPGAPEALQLGAASITLANFLTYKGVAVLFAPSLSALSVLAAQR